MTVRMVRTAADRKHQQKPTMKITISITGAPDVINTEPTQWSGGQPVYQNQTPAGPFELSIEHSEAPALLEQCEAFLLASVRDGYSESVMPSATALNEELKATKAALDEARKLSEERAGSLKKAREQRDARYDEREVWLKRATEAAEVMRDTVAMYPKPTDMKAGKRKVWTNELRKRIEAVKAWAS